MKKIGSLEVVRYKYELVDGDPKIVISMIKVLLGKMLFRNWEIILKWTSEK